MNLQLKTRRYKRLLKLLGQREVRTLHRLFQSGNASRDKILNPTLLHSAATTLYKGTGEIRPMMRFIRLKFYTSSLVVSIYTFLIK